MASTFIPVQNKNVDAIIQQIDETKVKEAYAAAMSKANWKMLSELKKCHEGNQRVNLSEFARRNGISEKTARRLDQKRDEIKINRIVCYRWLQCHPESTEESSFYGAADIRHAIYQDTKVSFTTGHPSITQAMYRHVDDFLLPDKVYSFQALSEILGTLSSDLSDYTEGLLNGDSDIPYDVLSAYREKLNRAVYSPDAIKHSLQSETGTQWPKHMQGIYAHCNFSRVDREQLPGIHQSLQPFYVWLNECYVVAAGKSRIEYIMRGSAEESTEKRIQNFFGSLNSFFCCQYVTRDADSSEVDNLETLYYRPSYFQAMVYDAQHDTTKEFLILTPIPDEYCNSRLIREYYGDTVRSPKLIPC